MIERLQEYSKSMTADGMMHVYFMTTGKHHERRSKKEIWDKLIKEYASSDDPIGFVRKLAEEVMSKLTLERYAREVNYDRDIKALSEFWIKHFAEREND